MCMQVEMDEEERAMVAEGAASQQNGKPTAAADKAPAAQPGKAGDGAGPADEDDDDNMRIVRDYKRSDAR